MKYFSLKNWTHPVQCTPKNQDGFPCQSRFPWYASRSRISYEAFKADSFLRWDFCRDGSCRGYDRTQQLNLLRISVIKPFEMNCLKLNPSHTKTSHHIHHTSPGLLTNSILFCWLLPIKDLCKKCVFTHSPFRFASVVIVVGPQRRTRDT